MKKTAIMLSLTLIITLFVAGCSGNQSATSSVAAEPPSSASQSAETNSTAPGEPVTLSMWVWDDVQVEPTQKMVDAFNEVHPNIKVEITSIAGVDDYNLKLQTVIGTRDAPHVYWLNFNLAKEYIPMGFVQNLSEYIEKDSSFDMNGLNAGITEAYTDNGGVYAIAKDTDSYATFYNKALFDAAGVSYPEDGWTMQDFARIAEQLTSDTVTGWSSTTGDRIWSSFIYANGGEVYSEDGMEAVINSPEAVEAVQNYLDIINKGHGYNGSQLAEVGAASAFASSLCAMTIDGSWMISQFSEALGDNLGIVEIPGGKAGKASVGHGIGYATTTENPYMQETWLLLSYLGTAAAQEMQVKVVIPAANDAAAAWESVYPDLNLSAFVKALTYSRPIPLANKNPTLGRSALQETIANMLAGQYADAQEAMDAAKVAMDAAING